MTNTSQTNDLPNLSSKDRDRDPRANELLATLAVFVFSEIAAIATGATLAILIGIAAVFGSFAFIRRHGAVRWIYVGVVAALTIVLFTITGQFGR